MCLRACVHCMCIQCGKGRDGEKKVQRMEVRSVCNGVCGLTACVGGLQSHTTEVKFAKIEHKHPQSPFPFVSGGIAIKLMTWSPCLNVCIRLYVCKYCVWVDRSTNKNLK